MKNILQIAKQMQDEAWAVIHEIDVINHWSSIGATVNLVGSLKTGLLIHNYDIDFHIYTNPFKLADSFLAMSMLAENKRIKTVNYSNLIEEEDRCVEWHAFYEDRRGKNWQIDMIHILNDSPYVGYFENVAERISNVLTQETREAILKIKYELPNDKKVTSIKIYQAVIEGGVRDMEAFWRWEEENQNTGIITWMP